MARIFPLRSPSAARCSRFVTPRLEALEDRFLLSGGRGPSYTTILTSLKVNPQQELVLPNGKILVGATVLGSGTFPDFNSGSINPGQVFGGLRGGNTDAIELVCLNADGSLDTAFGNNGVIIFQPNLIDTFANFAVQPDGKIVVVGAEISSGTGSVQPTPIDWPPGFPYPGPEYNFGHDVAGRSGLLVARFNTDGSLDTSFDGSQLSSISGFQIGTMAGGGVGAVTVQANGKIVIAGVNDEFCSPSIIVVRLNPDGSLDTGFNPGGPQPGVVTTTFALGPTTESGTASAIAIQGDGKIVVAGADFTSLLVLRFDADGTPDADFGSDGVASYATAAGTTPRGPSSLVVEADGYIL